MHAETVRAKLLRPRCRRCRDFSTFARCRDNTDVSRFGKQRFRFVRGNEALQQPRPEQGRPLHALCRKITHGPQRALSYRIVGIARSSQTRIPVRLEVAQLQVHELGVVEGGVLVLRELLLQRRGLGHGEAPSVLATFRRNAKVSAAHRRHE